MALRLILLGVVVYVGYRMLRSAFGGGGVRASEFPCATCRNCKALYDDGVICAFGRKETFKNETHIANCRDYQRGRAG